VFLFYNGIFYGTNLIIPAIELKKKTTTTTYKCRPINSETHFKVVIVSNKFDTCKNLIERHRMVNTVLKEQLDGPVHALSIIAKTPKQWEQMSLQSNNGPIIIPPSPNCLGGDGSLPSKNI
jgi:BolA-like protein 1